MKFIFYTLSIFLLPFTALAYTSLSGIEKVQGIPVASGNTDLGVFINYLFYIGVFIAIALGIFAIVRGGFEYMTSTDSGSKIQSAKNKIWAAIGGILLALLAITILSFINPQITGLEVEFGQIKKLESPEIGPSVSELLKNEGTESLGARDEDLEKIMSLSDKELADLINSTDQEDYKQALLTLMKRRAYLISRTQTNPTKQSIQRLDTALNRFESIDSKLDQKGIFNAATETFQGRILTGMTDAQGDWVPGAGNLSIGGSFDPSTGAEPPPIDIYETGILQGWSLLFKNNDVDAVHNAFQDGGGRQINNNFSESILLIANSSFEDSTKSPFTDWLDTPDGAGNTYGQIIGIFKNSEGTYYYSN